MTKVIPLQKNEITDAAAVLQQAFKKDPMFLWVFGSQKAYDDYSHQVFSTWVKYSLLYGKAYRTDNFSTVALMKTPDYLDFSLWGIIRSGMIFNIWYLGLPGWKRLLAYDELSKEHMIKNIGAQQPWYLWMLGTTNAFQGQGLGSVTLKHIEYEAAKYSGKTYSYIEATTIASARFYKRHGYTKLGFFSLPSGDPVECLGKDIDLPVNWGNEP